MRQGGRVFSAALNGSVNWPRSMERVMRSQTMRIKDLATDAENEKGKGALPVGIATSVQSYHIENEWGGLQEEDVVGDVGQLEEDEITDDG